MRLPPRPTDAQIDKAANIIAVRCRRVIQGILMDSEIHEADMEFSRIAGEVIRELRGLKE